MLPVVAGTSSHHYGVHHYRVYHFFTSSHLHYSLFTIHNQLSYYLQIYYLQIYYLQSTFNPKIYFFFLSFFFFFSKLAVHDLLYNIIIIIIIHCLHVTIRPAIYMLIVICCLLLAALCLLLNALLFPCCPTNDSPARHHRSWVLGSTATLSLLGS